MSDIHFIITGGTIDSLYHPPTETSEPAQTSIIPDYIKDAITPYGEYSFETLCMLDSGDITDDHRAKMIEMIESTDAQKIIITHGTNTLVDTLQYISANYQGDKTVILMGAMIPLKQFVMSDGSFNLGYAIAKAQDLNGGVYIAMHGKLFTPDKVTKNRAIARFEEL